MGRKSSIHQLPKDVKVELDKLIEKGSATIDDMMEYLETQGADVSRSAVGRHKKQMDKALERLRQSREIADTLSKQMGDKSEGEMSSAMREILRSMIFDVMMAGTDNVNPKNLMLLAKSLKDIEHTAHISQDREMKIRKEMREETERKATEAANNVDKIAKDNGLSGEAINDIRKHILGIGNE